MNRRRSHVKQNIYASVRRLSPAGWRHSWRTRFQQGLAVTADEARSHLRALHAIQRDGELKSEHEYLYSCLSILDTKASALLQFIALIVASCTLTLTVLPHGSGLGGALVFLALLISAISAFLTLNVIWVHWSETRDFDAGDYFDRLLAVRDARTRQYRWAWFMSLVSLFILIMGVAANRRV